MSAFVDADWCWSGHVVDGIEDALSSCSTIAEGVASLLARKERFKERSPFGRVCLNGSQRGRALGHRRVVAVKGRCQMAQLRVVNASGINRISHSLLFQRSR